MRHLWIMIILIIIATSLWHCEEIPVEYEYRVHQDYSITYEIESNAKSIVARFKVSSNKDTTVYNIKSPWSFTITGRKTMNFYLQAVTKEPYVDIISNVYVDDRFYLGDSFYFNDSDNLDTSRYSAFTYIKGIVYEDDHVDIIKGRF